MNQHFYTAEELGRIQEEIKVHQSREMLLCIDEILATLDTTNPAGLPWETARRHIQLIEGNRFATLAGVPVGAG